MTEVISLFPDFIRYGLGKTSFLEHSIEISPEAKLVKQRYFSVSPAIEKKKHSEIDNMLKMGKHLQLVRGVAP